MKAAVYARVSSEDQQERRTIETQLEFASKYCDLHKIDVVEWYQDDGVSGTIPLEDRDAGARLLADAKDGKFQLLLVYKLDRLGRSARVILNAVHELEQTGVKIRSMTQPFDTGDPSGRFLLTILAGVADLDRETILERLWYGANRAARKGKWLGGIVPYGYRVNDEGYLEINEDPLPGMDMSEADVVRLIFRLIAEQRYSTIRVADYLNSIGVPPAYKKDGRKVKKGKRKVNTAGVWTPSRIRNMIVNTTYKGIHLYGKRTNKQREIITREVPAIVSSDQWEKAQKVLKDNHLEAMRNAKRKYLLRGLIKCGLCGLNYCGTQFPGPGRKPKVYYVCNGKTTYRGKYMGKCPSKNIPAQWIEEMVWKQCVDFITHPGGAIRELATDLEERKSGQADLEAEERMIRKAIEDKEKEKQQILDLYRKQLITSADVEEQLLKIAREKEALQKQAVELARKIEIEKQVEQQFNNAEELLTDLRSKLEKSPSFEDRRQIVKTLVREIRVKTETDEKGKLQADITVNFTFSHVVNCTDRDSSNRPA